MEKIRRNPAKLSQLVKEFDLEILYQATSYEEQTLSISDVNRPALQLVGFYDYFQPSRLQILGRAEVMVLKAMAAYPSAPCARRAAALRDPGAHHFAEYGRVPGAH